jgi:hypothetical protein
MNNEKPELWIIHRQKDRKKGVNTKQITAKL